MMSKSLKIRLAKIDTSKDVNGPGNRLVFWFQGCPIRCSGCMNKDFWDFSGGKEYDLKALQDIIEALTGEIEGITLTGGEPLAQIEGAIALAKLAKDLGLTVVCFTGYTIEEIDSGILPGAKKLLRYLDILIEGRFIPELGGNYLWRGSANQRVIFLTKRYESWKGLLHRGGVSELKVSAQGVKVVTTLTDKFWRIFTRKLEERGLNKSRP